MADPVPNSVLHHVQQYLQQHRLGELSDGELLRRYAAAHDESAFAALLERHGPLVLGVCRRLLRQPGDVEDAFQAVFLVLVRKAGTLRASGSLAPWLYTVAHRLALRVKGQADRATARHWPLAETPELAAPSAAPVGELAEALDAELQRLPERYRAPLILCCLEGQTHAEAAKQLGWRNGTVSGRLARARELLRQRLLRRGLHLAVGTGSLVPAVHASAGVSPSLLANTCQAAVLVNAGAPVEGAARALLLAEETVRAMAPNKVRLVAGLMLTVSLAGMGTALSLYSAKGEAPTEELPVAQAPGAEPRPAQADRHGDLLPAGAALRLGTLRWRCPARVRGVFVCPGGEQLISFEDGCVARIWDTATGREIRHFGGQGSTFDPGAALLSPDGRYFCYSRGHEAPIVICMWDTATGKELYQVEIGEAQSGLRADLVAFSPDGKSFAVAVQEQTRDDSGLIRKATHKVQFREVATGKELWQTEAEVFVPGAKYVRSSAPEAIFSPDGKFVLRARADGTDELWDLTTSKRVLRLDVQPAVADDVIVGGTPQVFARDGKTLMTVNVAKATVRGTDIEYTGLVKTWDVVTGKLLRTWPIPEALNDDSRGGSWLEWDRGKELKFLSTRFAASRDGHYLTCVSAAGHVHVYDIRACQEVFTTRDLKAASGKLTSASFLEDGKTLVCGVWDGEFSELLFDVPTGQRLGANRGAVHSAQLLPDGKRMCGILYDGGASGMSAIGLWDVKGHRDVLAEQDGHRGHVLGLAISPDGQTLTTAANDGSLRQWHLVDGRETRRIAVPTLRNTFYQVHLSANGRTAAVCMADGNGTVELELWDVNRGHPLGVSKDWLADLSYPPLVALSPDGKVLATGQDTRSSHTLRLWDATTGKRLCEIKEPSDFSAERLGGMDADSLSKFCVFRPDGKVVATVRGREIALWDPAQRKSARRIVLPAPVAEGGVVLSPDGRCLASIIGYQEPDGETFSLREILTGKERWRVAGIARCLAYAPDGRTVAAAFDDCSVRLYAVHTGKELQRFVGHRARIRTLLYSPDSRRLISGSDDTTVLVWDVGRLLPAESATIDLDARQRERLWDDLGDTAAGKAGKAVGTLATGRQPTVAWLGTLLAPATLDVPRFQRQLRDLDSEDFAARRQAEEELEKLGEAAEPGLRKLLADNPSLETRQRVERILQRLDAWAVPAADILRAVRAVEVLEHVATSEAQQILQKLAQGAPGHRVTVEAGAALRRLAERSTAAR